jgi:hypothetical protein
VHGVETCCYSALCEPVNLCAFAEAIAVGVCAEHTPGSEVQGRAWEAGRKKILPNILQIIIH